MYSLILMTAMSTSPAQPQGIFFNRGGCSSATATASTGCSGVRATVRVRNVVETTIVRPLATLNANRPHVLRRLFARGGCGGSAMASTGCSGAAVAAADCGGVTAWVGPAPSYQPMPQVQAGGPLGNLVTRAAVHRQLAKALRSDKLNASQRAVAAACLADPDLYDAAVIKVTRDLKKAKLPASFGPVGAFGDGHILQILIDNLPAIIDAIKQIISMFSMGIITHDQMYAMIDEILQPYFTVLAV